jgi:hypothetical protein
VDEVRGDARAGGAEGVTEGDGAAVDVGLGAVEAELLLHREVLRREGLVDLDEVHLVEVHPRALEALLDRRHGADAHELRLHRGDAPLHEPREGGEPAGARDTPRWRARAPRRRR